MVQLYECILKVSKVADGRKNRVTKLTGRIDISENSIDETTGALTRNSIAPVVKCISKGSCSRYYFIIDTRKSTICNDLCIINNSVCKACERIRNTIRCTIISTI